MAVSKTTLACKVNGETRLYCFIDTGLPQKEVPLQYSAGTEPTGGIVVTDGGKGYITHLAGTAEVLHFLVAVRAELLWVRDDTETPTTEG